MNDVLCLSIDAESEAGAKIAKKYGVRGFPTLLWLSEDGSPRDSIGRYMPPDPFLGEVKRIKSGEGTIPGLRARIAKGGDVLDTRFDLIEKLGAFKDEAAIDEQAEAIAKALAAGEGFEAQSIDSRWKLTQRLRGAGLSDLADEQIAAIRELDPEGKSEPMRRIAFDALLAEARQPAGLSELEQFLATETHGAILFDGWYTVYSIHERASKSTRKRDEAVAARANARAAAAKLWRHTPEKHHAQVGNSIAWGFYEASDELTNAEKTFALEVAQAAVKAAKDDVNVIDTLACCLFINGRAADALKQVERCIELDPDNEEWKRRKAEFTKTSG